MAESSAGVSAIRRMVDAAWSANTAPAGPDDARVQGFAEFGLPPSSSLATEDQLSSLEKWRKALRIPANSAFVDGTLLQTVHALIDPFGHLNVLTPVTLWELTTFVDALVCFDRLYCIANPGINVERFNRLLGTEALSPLPDPDDGMLRRLATAAAMDGLANMDILARKVGSDDEFGQEVRTVAKGWQAVLGADLPGDSPFDTRSLDNLRVLTAYLPFTSATDDPSPAAGQPSGVLIDGSADILPTPGVSRTLLVLVGATRVPRTPWDQGERPPLDARRTLAATATYRTYVNQAVANALGVPYLPGTLRMPFRRLFVQRAAEVQDELATVALADRIFAKQQPSSPLTLPFFTSAVLQRAATRADIWAQMAYVREQSASFRRRRAELDALLERSEVSPDALKLQAAIRDEGLKIADLAGAAQQSASVALGVVAQTGIVPLAGAIKVGVDAAQGVGRGGGWTRVWRRLFHRHQYFLAQTNSQAIALTNAMPQIERLWELPKVGGYLDRFAKAAQETGRILKES
jgi:hypothetical protein